MRPGIQILLLNVIFAFGYFAGGYAGFLLAAPPSYASPIWPAAGVALAGILLHGKRLLPGIFAGSLAAQIQNYLDYSSFDQILLTELLGSGAAIGSCLQAVLGAALIRRYVGQHDPLIEEQKILRFLFLGGPVSCTVSATIGVALLYGRGIIVAGDIWLSWGTWWVGDTIGVLIFTPLILLYAGKPDSFWKPRRNFITYPMLGLLILVLAFFKFNQRVEGSRIRLEFDRQVTQLYDALQNHFEKLTVVNRTLKAFFDSSERVTAADFRQFTAPILTRLSDIQSLQWIPRITAEQRTELESQERFFIHEMDSLQGPIPAGRRDIFYPVYFVAPAAGNESVKGFDLNSQHETHQLIQRVIDTGRTLATHGVHLVHDPAQRMGIVLYSPVYEKRGRLPNVSLRRQYFKGFVANTILLEKEVAKVLNRIPDAELEILIRDSGQRLFTSRSASQKPQLDIQALQRTRTIELGGRSWQVLFEPSGQFYASQQSWTTWWLLIGGLLFSSLMGLGLMLLTGRAARVQELVSIKTRDLEEVNRHLNQEIQERRKLQQEQNSRSHVLELLAQVERLSSILQRIVLDVERMQPDRTCFILLVDDKSQTFRMGAAPSLPAFFSRSFEGMPIRDATGSCGTAAFRKKTIIVEDILSHPYWQVFRSQVLQTDYRSCWSEPIMSSKNRVLGTFAILQKKPAAAQQSDLDFIKRMTQLTAIAIEQKQNESELRIAATTFQSHEAILVTDCAGTILRVNQAFSRMTGYSASEAIGKNPWLLASDPQFSGTFRRLMKTLMKKGRWQGETLSRRKNGDVFPQWLIVTAVTNDQREVTHYVAIFSDITEQKLAEKEIHDLAFYDPLTGLPNRRLLLDRLQHEIVSAKRYQRFGALFFLDLDHFKRLNDSLGHQVGDELLVQISRRVSDLLREEDTACRLGGDEFIILIAAHAGTVKQAADHAAILADKLMDIISQPFMLQESPHHFSTSIGITIYPDSTDHPESIIQQADTAMYRAKDTGRNGVCFFRPSMQQLADRRLILEKEMREALRFGQFMLFYQPQVNPQGRVISVEALIRWRHPQKGMIAPGDFIPVAEDTQLILPIGEWVLTEACRQLALWDRQQVDIGHVAINVSFRQFRQADFIDQVKHAMRESHIAKNRLMIELTEGIVIDNIEDTVAKMLALQRMGVGISIDDFGKGYSSLSYLKQLPLSQLKIDQGFVRDITRDPNDAVIVETIINMARNLGLNVIAEGVETRDQTDFLLDRGCENFQGYLFGRPAPADQFGFKESPIH